MQKSKAYDWLTKFIDGIDLNFDDCFEGYKQLDSVADEYPELSGYILTAIRGSLKCSGFCADTSPLAGRVFCKAAEHVENADLVAEYNKILDQNAKFAMRCVPDLLKIHPEMAKYFFDKTK